MKRTPLPSHDFPDEGEVRTCRDCGAEWDTREYDDPPPWSCRRAPLESTGTLDRGSPLKPVSETNSGREHQKDEAYRDWCRNQECWACGNGPPCDPAHALTWGSGHGDWEAGEGNLLPLCRACHKLQHDVGVDTFHDLTGVNLVAAAQEEGRQYREEAV